MACHGSARLPQPARRCRGGGETTVMERMLTGAQLRSELLLHESHQVLSAGAAGGGPVTTCTSPRSVQSNSLGAWGPTRLVAPGPRVPVTGTCRGSPVCLVPSPCAVYILGKLPVCSFHCLSHLHCVVFSPKLPGRLSLTLPSFHLPPQRGQRERSGKGGLRPTHPVSLHLRQRIKGERDARTLAFALTARDPFHLLSDAEAWASEGSGRWEAPFGVYSSEDGGWAQEDDLAFLAGCPIFPRSRWEGSGNAEKPTPTLRTGCPRGC